MAGLLDFSQYDNPEAVGRLAFGAGLLNAAGPQMRPVSLGQALAQGLLGGQQASTEAAMNKRRNALVDLQMQQQQMHMAQIQEQMARQKQIEALAQASMNPGGELQGPPAAGETMGVAPPSFNQQRFLAGLAAIDPVQAMTMMQKQGPMKLSKGETLYDPNSNRPIYTAPDKADLPNAVQEYNFAVGQGYKGTFQQWDTERKKAGATNVQVGLQSPYAGVDSQGNPIVVQPANRPGVPPQVLTGPDGKPIRPAADSKPMTDTQANANLYSTRMEKADQIINQLEGQYNRTWLAGRQMAGEGALGMVANSRLPQEAQMVDQAQRDFVNAVLRRESGAVISPSEFANAKQQYFPQPGDSVAVVKQKAANRKTAIEGVRAAAGVKAPVNHEQPQPQETVRRYNPQTGRIE
jgi:anti-sigma28 factor (negative regulator of flagellin synthesis)